MGRLMIAELRRIAARRLVRLTVVLALVGIAAGGLAAFAFSDSLPEEAYQARVAEAEQRLEAAEDADRTLPAPRTGWNATRRSPTRSPTRAFPVSRSATSTIRGSGGVISGTSSRE